ncbi:hypothetical protein GCM10023194_61450 [Planotetraspora phitsanulokensis]|uniref:DUF1440 domain-containing protein n=1 Tax=Planotetraspora phitsanulokensis TaxID=575192 RepID=A0A8J3U7Z5_9ACTN|nr:DUF6789 family protein [Planotetraspora phitsanulokensis]GII37634.1 hypothetical protein Pph01_26370 [Planotetraspora phitsanulokensis]
MTRNMVNGAVGGALATAVYSAILMAGERAGLLGHPPPKRVMRVVLPGSRHRPKPGEGALATIGHFAYGSTAGAALGLLFRGQRVPLPVGAAYGLAVWYASFQHMMPRLGTYPPASRDSPGRQALLALGHMVYGTSLAISMNRLRSDRTPGARILPSEHPERSKFLTPPQPVP